jgi:hypothetical protein
MRRVSAKEKHQKREKMREEKKKEEICEEARGRHYTGGK